MNKASEAMPIGTSTVEHAGTTYELVVMGGKKFLSVRGDQSGFAGSDDAGLFPLSAGNAATLRSRLQWLNPVPLGLTTSFGFGDRLGLATEGHVQSLRAVREVGKEMSVAPIFAQQSVRENTRTGRTPQQVMDDAMWGVFETGWRDPWGADADHIKILEHLPPFVAAGYTFYTLDPSDHVDNDANHDSIEVLRQKVTALKWEALQTDYDSLWARYANHSFMPFTEEIILRALVKYGRALIHTATIADALRTQLAGKPFDLEMSVDETDTPTTTQEHFFIANELVRLKIPVTSLAPRFVGKFQKGVDYIGDPAEFEREFVHHAAIMKHFGTYKMSIHTGSDKFSLYPIIAKYAGTLVHVKTAGTSYLEALRVVAQSNPNLFRRILTLARERFQIERKSYYLDAELDRVPTEDKLTDAQLPDLLNQLDSRQVLHVVFGSVLTTFAPEFQNFIVEHIADYNQCLKVHFLRHLTPFCKDAS